MVIIMSMKYEEMLSALSMTTDDAMRLEMLMDFGAHMPPVPGDAVCTEIMGCTSRVQICRAGNRFYGTADSAMVRGIVALITAMVDGKTPEQIRQMDIRGAFDGLKLPLGAGRMNGVNSMISFLQNL